MRTNDGRGVAPAGGIFTGESMSTLTDEIDFRMSRLEVEAAREHLAGPRDGLRQYVGHGLLGLGHLNHLRPRHPIAHGHRPYVPERVLAFR